MITSGRADIISLYKADGSDEMKKLFKPLKRKLTSSTITTVSHGDTIKTVASNSLSARESSSATMNILLKAATNIDDYLNQNQDNMNNQSLYEHLNYLLIEKNLRVAEVKTASGLEKAYVYQIFAGQKKPSRDKLIAIAFGLGLTDEETDKLLKVARYQYLYPRDNRDAIIKFCLRQGMSIQETEDALEARGFQTLISPK